MKKKGFTLIELMVAMVIIGILTALSLAAFTGARKTARDSKRKADLEEVRSALEMCRTDDDEGEYPIGTLVSGSAITCDTSSYMTIPADPLSGQRYYYTSSDGVTYALCAKLETETGANCNYAVAEPGGSAGPSECVIGDGCLSPSPT